MPLKAYDEVASEPLSFPIGDKTYTAPPVGARTGIFLIRALGGDPDLSKLDSRTLWQVLLGCTEECTTEKTCGSVYDQMMADDVPLDALARAGYATLVDWQQDRSAAERVWESGIDPNAKAAAAAALQSTMQPSTPLAEETTTPTPASGTRTRTKKTTAKKTANRSGGSRSSRTGR